MKKTTGYFSKLFKKLITFFCVLTLFLSGGNLQAQTCKVDITQAQIVNVNYPQFDIKVSGIVVFGECTEVKITLNCNAGPPITLIVKPDSVFNWTVLFDSISCPCNNGISRFSVVAECVDLQKCPGKDKADIRYICPQGVCPTINLVNADIGGCNNDSATSCGYRIVTFTPFVTGMPTFYQWNFGDGTDTTGNGIPGVITHKYFKPPTFTPKLTLFTVNCNPITVEYNISGVNFDICDNCPIDPQIAINITSNGCNLNGNVTANFCEEQYNSFLIDFGDGNSQTYTNLNILNGFSLNHTYSSDGTYNLKIILQKNGINCTYSRVITITNCKKGSNGNGNDDCLFCFCSSFWCCLLYILFILALISLIVSLSVALCTGAKPAWIVFVISLAAVILLAILLVVVCDVGICELFIALGVGGLVNWAIVCGTNLIPCNSWLCQLSTIPILGVQVQNFLIINVVIWLLALLLCST